MKHRKKAIALLLASVFALTGCTRDEQKFITALDKLSEAKYYEQQSHISFGLNFSGGDEYFREDMEKMKHIVDALAIDSSTAYEGSVKNDTFKSHINAAVELDPVTLSGEIWFDMDMVGDNPKYEIIAKIPALAKAFMSEGDAKDYLYIDYVKYMDALISSAGMQSYSLAGLGSIPQIFKTPTEMQKWEQGLFEIIKKSETLSGNYTLSSKTEGGMERLTLKMSDKQLKGFILAMLSEMRTNEDMLDMFVEAFVPRIPGFWNYMYEVEGEQGDTKQFFVDSFDETLVALEEYFNSNTLLGSGGLLYEITIDENGYITDEYISVPIRLSEELYDFAPYYQRTFIPFFLDEDSGTLDLTINVKTENSGFNSNKIVKIPTLTKENTFDVLSVMMEEAEQDKENSAYRFPYVSYMFEGLSDVGEAPVDFPIVGTYENKELNSVVSLINASEYGGDFCMPLRQAAELFGGEVGWNAEQKSAFWKLGDKALVLPAGDSAESDRWYYGENNGVFEGDLYTAYNGGIINGMAFVGLSDLEYFLDVDFGFDDNANTLLLR